MKKSRTVFFLFLFIWISILDFAVLRNFDFAFYNFITGNIIHAASLNSANLPLFIANAIIIMCFSLSYYNWETRLWQKAKRAKAH